MLACERCLVRPARFHDGHRDLVLCAQCCCPSCAAGTNDGCAYCCEFVLSYIPRRVLEQMQAVDLVMFVPVPLTRTDRIP